jgi:hypothetical protein
MRASFPRRPFVLAALSGLAFVSLSCGGGSDGGPPEPASVVVTPGLDTLFSLNESRVYSAVVLDAVGDPVDGAEVAWSSSDATVLTVGAETGLVTARKNGAATITASSGDLSGSANAFVVQVVTSVTVTPGNVSLTAVGDTVRFTAVARDSGNSVVSDAQILWDLNDNTVATIDTLGLATTKGPGMVLVQAQAQARAGYASLSVTQAAASLVFLSAPSTGTAGLPFSTAVQVEVRDSNGARVRNAAIPVTLSLAGGAGPFGMVGVSTMTTVDGVASFQNVGATRAGTVQLTANGGGLQQAMGAPFPVAFAAPARLTIADLNDTLVAGDTLRARIEVQDQFGNLTDLDGVQVNVLLRRSLGVSSFDSTGLTGFNISTSVDGVIDYWQTLVNAAGSNWTFLVRSAQFDSVKTSGITVIPGAPFATGMWFTGIPAISPWIGVGAPGSPGFNLTITDRMGNLTVTAPATGLTLELVGWEYEWSVTDTALGQQLLGTLTTTTAAGIGPLPNAGLRRPGRTQLRATGGGFFPYMYEIDARIRGKHGITAGESHACLIGDGGAYCWGDNSFGQLSGSGALDSVARPVQGTPPLVAIDAGVGHTCGLTAAGEAYCWGANGTGQLGRGSTGGSSPTPALVLGGITFRAISAGAGHTCGIRASDSLAFCWGANGSSQLGDSTSSTSSTPVLVKGGHKFINISAGELHTCGVEAGALGLAWCWGDNGDGEGGTGSLVAATYIAPNQVAVDSNLRVLAGVGYSCAEYRRPDGGVGVQCWGRRPGGVLGDSIQSLTPKPTPGPIAILTSVAAGSLVVGEDHACVRATNTQIYCWGSNGLHERFRDGGGDFYAPFLTAYAGNGAGTEIAAGGTFTCVVTPPSGFGVTVGDTRCGGRWQEGQLGHGRTTTGFFYVVDADQ